MKTRQQIIDRVRRQLAEIEQYFNDVEHWNNGRGLTEGKIEADPDGEMARCKKYCEGILKNEIRISEPKHKG
jgi:hypothetical protein